MGINFTPRHYYSFFCLVLLFSIMQLETATAQNGVGVNPTGAAPDPSAGLDVDYPDKGVLLPRVALTVTSLASPITNPATGLLVYNTATVNDVAPGFYYWNGGLWVPVTPQAAPGDTLITCGVGNLYYTLRGDGNGAYVCTSALQASSSAVGIGTSPSSFYRLRVSGSTSITSGALYVGGSFGTTINSTGSISMNGNNISMGSGSILGSGTVSISNTITATKFIGDLTGDVTGGTVSGVHSGSWSGTMTGATTITATRFVGDLTGDVTGGTLSGIHSGSWSGTMTGATTITATTFNGNLTGNWTPSGDVAMGSNNINFSSTGGVSGGSHTGTFSGTHSGTWSGSLSTSNSITANTFNGDFNGGSVSGIHSGSWSGTLSGVSTITTSGSISCGGSVTAGSFRGSTISLSGSATFSIGSGSGSTVVSSSGSLRTTTSTIRAKENIHDYKVNKEKLFKTRLVSYNLKKALGGDPDVGVIAEEVAKLSPEVVVWGPKRVWPDNSGLPLKKADGQDSIADKTSYEPYSVKYDKFGLFLIPIVKEQDEMIQKQQKEIADLRERLSKLEKYFAKLEEKQPLIIDPKEKSPLRNPKEKPGFEPGNNSEASLPKK